jgi:pilus assembly protein FimV
MLNWRDDCAFIRIANGMPSMPSNMHSNKRPPFGPFNLKTISVAVASALLFSNAYAAGLGKLTVLSSLGQPLRAEIELTSVSKDEAGTLAAKLASADAFRQANIDYHSALMSLRFAVEQRGERQFIRVTSGQPLNEPFVDMLLELSGPNGRLIREYTFLLDPPDLRTTQSAQSAQSAQVAPAPLPESTVTRTQPIIQAEPASQAASESVTKPRQEGTSGVVKPGRQSRSSAEARGEANKGEYRVRNGDYLARIASQMKPSGVSLDQMLVALYQANPDAFVGNNMNRLKAGQILSVPNAETAHSISGTEARGVIVAQAADFNTYRSKLAGQVATAAAQKTKENTQSVSGKITAKVEEKPTPASESKDKLKLSNTLSVPGAKGDKAAGSAGTAEDKIAKEKAIAEAGSRVKELEKNVNELQKLLEVKNKNLADQQKQADAAKAEVKPATPPAPVASAPSAVPAAPTVTPPAMPAKPAEPQLEKPATPPAPVAKPKPKTVAPPSPPEQSFIDELMANPFALPGLGALLVALGGLGIYRARRQKQGKQFEDSIIADSSLKTNSLFGSTGGQSVDTNNSVFNSSFSLSANQLDTNEVDPVAEADVYIAYGRDAQAEEILKEALRTQPDRHALRVKLLEIYSNRKDLRAFEVLASELYSLTKGQGDEWAQAAVLGIAIDPNNPLYAGSTAGKDNADLVAPTQPLDEQGLATLLSTTQSDTSSLETTDSLEADTGYFSNTALAAEVPLEPLPESEPVPAPEPAPKPSSNDLDFDLDGLNLGDMAVPNTIPHPAPAEPSVELTSIDFDFLDEPNVPAAELAPEPVAEVAPESEVNAIPPIADLEFNLNEPTAAEAPAAEMSGDVGTPQAEIAPLEINIPGLDGATPASEVKSEAAIDPLDFDLSGISLELNPTEFAAKPYSAEGLPEDLAGGDETFSSNTEMATKLDLAIAYQEIGDKEGARELLDEVLKGGTPEQSEKAKSLLLELA